MNLNLLMLQTEVVPEAAGSSGSMISMIVMLVGMVGFMYLFIWRPEKKKKKANEDMLKALEVGDEITTIGGIVGIVYALREDELVLETGSDRSKIIIKRWAIQGVTTVKDDKSEDL